MKNCCQTMNPKDLVISPIDSTKVIWGHTISDLQENVFVGNGKIVGSLKKVDSGALAQDWGEGYFLALQFDGPAFDNAIGIYVGMEPSVSSGLANIMHDPDRNGIFKVTSHIQMFKLVIDYGGHIETYLYDLSNLNNIDESSDSESI